MTIMRWEDRIGIETLPGEWRYFAMKAEIGELRAAAVMALAQPVQTAGDWISEKGVRLLMQTEYDRGYRQCKYDTLAHPAQPTEQMVTPYISQAQFDRTFPDAPIAQPVQMSKDEFVARSADVGLSSAVAECLASWSLLPSAQLWIEGERHANTEAND